jgi:hypothetical protein
VVRARSRSCKPTRPPLRVGGSRRIRCHGRSCKQGRGSAATPNQVEKYQQQRRAPEFAVQSDRRGIGWCAWFRRTAAPGRVRRNTARSMAQIWDRRSKDSHHRAVNRSHKCTTVSVCRSYITSFLSRRWSRMTLLLDSHSSQSSSRPHVEQMRSIPSAGQREVANCCHGHPAPLRRVFVHHLPAPESSHPRCHTDLLSARAPTCVDRSLSAIKDQGWMQALGKERTGARHGWYLVQSPRCDTSPIFQVLNSFGSVGSISSGALQTGSP